jgi:hypothetical protein
MLGIVGWVERNETQQTKPSTPQIQHSIYRLELKDNCDRPSKLAKDPTAKGFYRRFPVASAVNR